MIQVRTWDMPNGGVGIELSGHADVGEDLSERSQVCAGASMLLVTLAAMTNGTWGGNESGSVVCLVVEAQIAHAEFVLAGLMLLKEAYKGLININRSDTRLGVEWKERAEKWADQHREPENT